MAQKQAHTWSASITMNSGTVYSANTARHNTTATPHASQRKTHFSKPADWAAFSMPS